MGARITRAAYVVSLCAACWSGPSLAQESDELRLPKGGVAPPAALLAGLPADAAEVYRLVPADENAEAAYLVALSEFDAAMAGCWPKERRRERQEILWERGKPLLDLLLAEAQEKPIDAQARDAAIAGYRAGWESLVRAQQKPRCRFAISIGTPDWPHMMAARQVERVARLMALADLEKRDLDAALGRLRVVLRLSRDLRPGGPMACQLASSVMQASACREIGLPILRSPALRSEHCLRLIAVLRDQEHEGIDPFRAQLLPDALLLKSMFAGMQSHPESRKHLVDMFRSGGPPDINDLLRDDPPDERARREREAVGRRAGDRLAAMTDADFAAALRTIDTYYSRWWRFAPTSYTERVRAAPEFAREALGDDPLLAQFIPGATTFRGAAESVAYGSYGLRAVQAMAAVRRWSLEHGELSPELASAAQAAGLPEAPRDPFADAPLKLTVIDGSPVIYSVGPDQKDDGGTLDAQLGSKREGDWIIRLSPEPPGR